MIHLIKKSYKVLIGLLHTLFYLNLMGGLKRRTGVKGCIIVGDLYSKKETQRH